MKISFLIFLFFSYRTANSSTLTCKYLDNSYFGYSCQVQNLNLITSRDDREVIEVYGNHKCEKFDDDVKHFSSLYKKVEFFPRRLTKIFRNIEIISIFHGNLRELTQNDLREFGDKLKDLRLGYNDIEVIKENLFEFNKNLEKILIHNNKIKKIEVGTFRGLEKLINLDLRENFCTNDEDFAAEKSKVFKLIEDVEKKCENY